MRAPVDATSSGEIMPSRRHAFTAKACLHGGVPSRRQYCGKQARMTRSTACRWSVASWVSTAIASVITLVVWCNLVVVLYGGFVCENACKRNLRGSNPRPLAV